MLRITMVLTTVLMTALVGSLEAQSIQGIWRLTGGETLGGPNDGMMVEFQGGLLVYGENHFVWALDINENPRPVPAEGASSDAIVEAIQGYNSVAGTYELDGETITYAMTTNLASGGQGQELERRIMRLTDDTLVTGLTNEDGVTTTLIYERVE